MSADGGVSMQEAIADGRAKYVAQRYKQALGSFTDVSSQSPSLFTCDILPANCLQAIKLCPCEVEKKKRKRSDSVGQKPDQNAQPNREASSLPTPECGNPLHIQALNYRAATFEKIPDFRRALADAGRMMDIAPCSPEGYLRASKVLRMEEHLIDALQILTDGILIFLERGNYQVDDLRRLEKARSPLKPKFARVDPLGGFLSLSWMSKAHLPTELVLDIFGRLELSKLCHCLRVSKTWKDALTAPASAHLWRSLVFTGASTPKKPISFENLKKLLSYSSNNIRELVIRDARRLYLDRRKFNAFLNAGTKLERLEVANPCEAVDFIRPPQHLKYLSLEGFHRFYRPGYAGADSYRSFLLAVVPGLETLILSGLPRQWLDNMQVPMMPNLRHVKLSKGREQPWSLSVCALLKSTPQLEQLYLENLFLDCKLPNDDKFDESCVPNLKSVTISDMKVMVFERGDNNLWLQQGHSAALEANRLVTALNGGKKLKALDIHYNWQYTDREDAAFDVFGRMLQDPSYQYEDLEILRLSKLVLAPQTAERLFGSAVRSGKLSSFDICFPLPTFNETEGRTSLEHIQKYQWLEGAESIRCLGIYDFSFKRYLKGSEHPLIQFLQTFPLLEEVRLGSTSSGGPEYYYTVSDILSLVKLKRVEISDIHGSSFDRLRRMARDETTILTWEAQPPKWPLSFKHN